MEFQNNEIATVNGFVALSVVWRECSSLDGHEARWCVVATTERGNWKVVREGACIDVGRVACQKVGTASANIINMHP
jgi:hypothetical protein